MLLKQIIHLSRFTPRFVTLCKHGDDISEETCMIHAKLQLRQVDMKFGQILL